MHRRGQILVESIVAISVASIGLLGILTLLARSLAYNRNVTEKFVAVYLASEGVEIAKNIIDSEWASAGGGSAAWNTIQQKFDNGSYELVYDTCVGSPPFPGCIQGNIKLSSGYVLSTTPLDFDPSLNVYDYSRGNVGSVPTAYSRVVQIKNKPGEIQVTAIVNWQSRGVDERVSVEDHFFAWR